MIDMYKVTFKGPNEGYVRDYDVVVDRVIDDKGGLVTLIDYEREIFEMVTKRRIKKIFKIEKSAELSHK
jgi:hypothetical protein